MGHSPLDSDRTHRWSLAGHSDGPVRSGSSTEDLRDKAGSMDSHFCQSADLRASEGLSWTLSLMHKEKLLYLVERASVVGLTTDDLLLKPDGEL